MNQQLPALSRHTSQLVSSTPSQRHLARAQRFMLQVRLRGQLDISCEVPCRGLEEAIQFAEAHFPAFAERNPWIGLDSLQQKIWILLDPEIEGTC